MALSLSELRNKRKTIIIDYDGTDVEFSYNPAVFNSAFNQEIQDLIETKEEGTLFRGLAKILVGTNIVDDEGKPYPLNEESLAELPTQLMYTIWAEILKETTVPLEKKTAAKSVAA